MSESKKPAESFPNWTHFRKVPNWTLFQQSMDWYVDKGEIPPGVSEMPLHLHNYFVTLEEAHRALLAHKEKFAEATSALASARSHQRRERHHLIAALMDEYNLLDNQLQRAAANLYRCVDKRVISSVEHKLFSKVAWIEALMKHNVLCATDLLNGIANKRFQYLPEGKVAEAVQQALTNGAFSYQQDCFDDLLREHHRLAELVRSHGHAGGSVRHLWESLADASAFEVPK